MPANPFHTGRQDGFTVIEVMIALAIIGVLVAVAAPSFRQMIMNMRMTGAANDLIADLSYARSEAAKQNLNVLLCSSSNNSTCSGANWNNGWIIFADLDADRRKDANEPPLKTRTFVNPDIVAADRLNVTVCGDSALPGGGRGLSYSPAGTSTVTGAAFALCDGRTTTEAGRLVRVNASGRAVVSKITCAAGGFTPTCP